LQSKKNKTKNKKQKQNNSQVMAFNVSNWLQSIGLPQYSSVFLENELTNQDVIKVKKNSYRLSKHLSCCLLRLSRCLPLLLFFSSFRSGIAICSSTNFIVVTKALSDAELKDIGVTVLGHRKKINLEAAKFGGGAAPSQPSPAAGATPNVVSQGQGQQAAANSGVTPEQAQWAAYYATQLAQGYQLTADQYAWAQWHVANQAKPAQGQAQGQAQFQSSTPAVDPPIEIRRAKWWPGADYGFLGKRTLGGDIEGRVVFFNNDTEMAFAGTVNTFCCSRFCEAYTGFHFALM